MRCGHNQCVKCTQDSMVANHKLAVNACWLHSLQYLIVISTRVWSHYTDHRCYLQTHYVAHCYVLARANLIKSCLQHGATNCQNRSCLTVFPFTVAQLNFEFFAYFWKVNRQRNDANFYSICHSFLHCIHLLDRMYSIRPIAIDNPIAWCVCLLSVCHVPEYCKKRLHGSRFCTG